jgi:hypothetical protein
VVESLKTVSDKEMRGRLFTELMALMANITDDVELDKLLAAAVQSQSIADFQLWNDL